MRSFNFSLRFKSNRVFLLFISCFFPIAVLILQPIVPLSSVHSAQVTLGWDSNAEQDLAGYKIYYGTSSNNYSWSVDVGNNTRYTLSGLESGKNYYFVATAYDLGGNESNFSTELAYKIPLECTYSISPTSQSFNASGDSGTVNVSTQSGCSWTAVSDASWLVITSNSNMTGNGTVNYSVATHTETSSRTGTLTIAGNAFSVTQSGSTDSMVTLTVTKRGTGSGTVTNTPNGTAFSKGTVVTLTAVPDANSTFTGWSGGCSGTSTTTTITMNSDLSVTATFILKTYTIKASVKGSGSISPSGDVTVPYGGSQSFTLSPKKNYVVSDVKVDGVSVGRVSSFKFSNVTGNHSITATFARRR